MIGHILKFRFSNFKNKSHSIPFDFTFPQKPKITKTRKEFQLQIQPQYLTTPKDQPPESFEQPASEESTEAAPPKKLKSLLNDLLNDVKATKVQTGEFETYNVIEKNYMKQCEQAIELNDKTRRYHMWQYSRGQQLQENIPISPYKAYTIRNKERQLEYKKKFIKERYGAPYDNIERAETIKDRIQLYHDKQRRFEIEEFMKHLNNYPGSKKGPLPTDDPDAFRAWGKQKMPLVLEEEIKEAFPHLQKSDNNSNTSNDDDVDFKIQSDIHTIDMMGTDMRPVLTKEQQERRATKQIQPLFDFSEESLTKNGGIITDMMITDIPRFPTVKFTGYFDYISELTAWSNFRRHYFQKNKDKIIDKQMQFDQQMFCLERGYALDEQWVQLPANIPSLYRYYKCLPKSMQDHPGVKDVYLGLEYSQPDFSYEEKENGLNYACTLALPLDQVSTRGMEELTKSKKFYVTPFLGQKMKTMELKHTWDIHEFFDAIKQEQLRGHDFTKAKQARYPEPPHLWKLWEEGVPNLPVDFYDNDDGFWDEHIKEKLKRYDQFKPMLKTRKYFKH